LTGAQLEGLSVDVATADERPIFDNLLQLYVHDFSELFAGTPRCDLGDDGRYAVDIPIGTWWTAAQHVPLLFRLDGRLAGFALLNATGHGDVPIDRNVAEFFVVRKYRRTGLGRAAAQTLFSRYPGRWEAAVMRANTGARTFWDRTITSHGALAGIEIGESSNFTWNGTIFRFAIKPA
jgi:predicted acetyltransferase